MRGLRGSVRARVHRGPRTGGTIAALALAAAVPAAAAELQVRVVDAKGRPVRDAVIAAYPLGGVTPDAGPTASAVIDQIDEQFVPEVSALRVGTAVAFPNRDDIRHHVYSFSKAKRFELPLYKGTPAQPVVFDKPGLVVLGCNIHDWMVGYVYVLSTPWFAMTDGAGSATVAGLAPGEYRVEVRHPRARDEAVSRELTLGAGSEAPIDFSLPLKPEFRRSRVAGSAGREY